MDLHDLPGRFVTMQVADDHPSSPIPRCSRLVCRKPGSRPDAVMIGDTTYDIEMGRAAGMRTIGVSWGYHPVGPARGWCRHGHRRFCRLVLGSGHEVYTHHDGLEGETLLDGGDCCAGREQLACAARQSSPTHPCQGGLGPANEEMARAIAAEWAEQGEEIDPLSMPVTRSANSAIDRVATQHGEVADMLAAYAETDLLCHRAETPLRLHEQQAAAWDPLLDWAEHRFGARLAPTTGILPVAQAEPALRLLSDTVHGTGAFQLTALHDLVSLSGSLILGLAVAEGRLDPAEGWRLSRIDEDWQIAQQAVRGIPLTDQSLNAPRSA
jgi:hypothetical protein